MSQKIKQDISVGDNIRALRQKCNLTQEQVAARLQIENIDMSQNFYSHIETGRYNIRVSELAALKKIFNCEYNDFFDGI